MQKYLCTCLIIAWGICYLLLAAAVPTVVQDSVAYVESAQRLSEFHIFETERVFGHLGLEEYPQVTRPNHLQLSRLHEGKTIPSYPLGFPLLLVPFLWLFGKAGLSLCVPLTSMISLWLTSRLAIHVGKKRYPHAGWLAVLCLGLFPYYFRNSTTLLSDIPATMWFLLSLYLFVVHNDRKSSSLFAGLAYGMMVLTRTELIVSLPLFILLTRKKSNKKNILLSLCGFTCMLIVIIISNKILYGNYLSSRPTLAISGKFSFSNIPPSMSLYSGLFFRCGFFISMLSGFYGTWLLRNQRLSAFFAVWFAVLLVMYGSYFYYTPQAMRFFLTGAAGISILSGIGINHLINTLHRPATRVVSLLLLIVIMSGFFISTLMKYPGLYSNKTIANDLEVTMTDWLPQHVHKDDIVFSSYTSGLLRYFEAAKSVQIERAWYANLLEDLTQQVHKAGGQVYFLKDNSTAADIIDAHRYTLHLEFISSRESVIGHLQLYRAARK